MNLTLWKPFSELNRFFADDWEINSEENLFSPRVHVEESDTHLIVQAELPGMNENEITVNIEKEVLTISGERKVEKKEEKKGYYYSEIQFGKFERKMRLPEYVDSEKTEAEYKKGVLNIKLEKKPESAPKKIEVKTGK